MCRFEGAGTGSVEGRVEIRQANTTSPAVFRVEVRGLGSSAKHGLHVHQRGDTGDNCGAAGGHFNPLHVGFEILNFSLLISIQIWYCNKYMVACDLRNVP